MAETTPPRNGPTLREYFEGLFAAHKDLHTDHDKAHAREHEFAEKAIETAAELAKTNKADANEWRAAMSDRELSFATKEDVKANRARLEALERAEIKRSEAEANRRETDIETKRLEDERRSRQQWTVGLIVLLVSTFAAVLLNFLIRASGH